MSEEDDNEKLGGALKEVAAAATAVAGLIPGIGGVIGRIIGLVLQTAAGFAEQGLDPEIEIKRVLSSSPEVRDIHDRWDGAIRDKFHPNTDPPDKEDPYDE
jgi:hypothetical protein